MQISVELDNTASILCDEHLVCMPEREDQTDDAENILHFNSVPIFSRRLLYSHNSIKVFFCRRTNSTRTWNACRNWIWIKISEKLFNLIETSFAWTVINLFNYHIWKCYWNIRLEFCVLLVQLKANTVQNVNNITITGICNKCLQYVINLKCKNLLK